MPSIINVLCNEDTFAMELAVQSIPLKDSFRYNWFTQLKVTE